MLTQQQFTLLRQLYTVTEIPFLVMTADGSDVTAFPEHSERFFNPSYWLDGHLQAIQNTHKHEVLLNNVGEFSNQIVVWISDTLLLHTVPIRTSLQSPYHLYALIEKGVPTEARAEFFRFLLDVPPKSSKQLCDFASLAAALFSGRRTESIFLASMPDDPKLQHVTRINLDELPDLTQPEDSTTIVAYYNHLCDAIAAGDMTKLLDTLQSPVAGSKTWMTPGMIKDARYEFTNLLSIISKAAIDAGVPANIAIQTRKRFVIIMDSLNDIQQVVKYGYHCSQKFCELVRRYRQDKELSSYTKNAKDYIADHLYDNIDTDTVSEALHINKKTLNTYFKNELNTSVYHYILNQRLEESHDMLKNTVLPISYISELFYFSSQSHFTRHFKEKYGITPHQFRIGTS